MPFFQNSDGYLTSQAPPPDPRRRRQEIDELLRRSLWMFQREKFGEVIRLCRQVLAQDPNNAQAYNNLGAVYLQKGQLNRAEEALRKALELDPTLSDAEENLFRLRVMRRVEESGGHPVDVEGLMKRGREMVSQGRLEEALDLFREAAAREPRNVRAFNNLGIVSFQMGKPAQAEEYFCHALELYFRHGLMFDDLYEQIKENLRRLRATTGVKLSEEEIESLEREVKPYLEKGEKAFYHISGASRVLHEGRWVSATTYLTATTRRLILYSKNAKAFPGGSKVESFAYRQLQAVRVVRGSRNAVLSLRLEGELEERRLTAASGEEFEVMRGCLEELRNYRARGDDPDDYRALASVAIRLAAALRNLGALTDEEYQARRLAIVSGQRRLTRP